MNKPFQIKLRFDSGVTHETPDVRRQNPGWNEDLNVLGRITTLQFELPDKIELYMEGMEQYNFFVEATQALGSRRHKGSQLEAFWFLGQYRDSDNRKLVMTYCVRFRDNQILKNVHKLGEEYFGTPTRGWKAGVKGAKARAGVLQDGKLAA